MKLPKPFTGQGDLVNAIIETPSGSRNKFAFDPVTGLFKLSKVLPGGTDFPLDMGFVPGTKEEDGDPLDILLIMEKPTYPGCLVECRVLGVIEATQEEDGKKPERNDRILAVPEGTNEYSHVKSIRDMEKKRVEDIIGFFEYYNKMEHRVFKLLDVRGPKRALKLIKKHML